MKCVACGSTSLVEGALIESAGNTVTRFKPDDVSTWRSMLGLGVRDVRAYGCIHCGHLQLAVDFSEADSQRYRQFEGQQPTILERLNPDRDEMGG